MPTPVEAVLYHGETPDHFAIVTRNDGGGNLDILECDPATGGWTPRENVPHREPEDYDAGGGGGHTWKEIPA